VKEFSEVYRVLVKFGEVPEELGIKPQFIG
jgi:hypothetical protein